MAEMSVPIRAAIFFRSASEKAETARYFVSLSQSAGRSEVRRSPDLMRYKKDVSKLVKAAISFMFRFNA